MTRPKRLHELTAPIRLSMADRQPGGSSLMTPDPLAILLGGARPPQQPTQMSLFGDDPADADRDYDLEIRLERVEYQADVLEQRLNDLDERVSFLDRVWDTETVERIDTMADEALGLGPPVALSHSRLTGDAGILDRLAEKSAQRRSRRMSRVRPLPPPPTADDLRSQAVTQVLAGDNPLSNALGEAEPHLFLRRRDALAATQKARTVRLSHSCGSTSRDTILLMKELSGG